jgi:hypothetical protein
VATLDATTQAEYAAEVNAADRAQAIIDALVDPVYAKVYDSEDNVVASGEMTSPWATISGNNLVPTTLDGFFVSSAGTPNDGWYFQFESGSRYLRTTFGLSGSGKEAVWNLPTWDVGTRAGISPSAITVAGDVPLKWHPGHYAMPDAVLFSTSTSAHTTLWGQISSVSNFVGGSIIVPWGQLEPTTAGNYTWTLLDAQIAALDAVGKKASIVVWSHRYSSSSLPSTPQTGDRYFPDYLISSGDVVAGGGIQQATLWREATMDRYIALFDAIADRYESDDRVAFVKTAETAFVNTGGDFSGAGLLAQWARLAEYLPTIFQRTPVSVEANFLVTQTDMPTLMQACVDSGAGMGGPDMFPVEFSGSSDNWGQRCLRGERYVGGVWTPGVATNFQPVIPVLMEQQVVRSTSATPAMYYNAAVTRYSATHVTWQAKTTAFLYGSGGATLVPAMDWANVLAYVRDNSLPLRTTTPTALS